MAMSLSAALVAAVAGRQRRADRFKKGAPVNVATRFELQHLYRWPLCKPSPDDLPLYADVYQHAEPLSLDPASSNYRRLPSVWSSRRRGKEFEP
jgi:hypothetical protein